jgi:hypothetical protein
MNLSNHFEVDGTGVKAPVMSLGEGLVRMSLDDPAPATNKPIKPPTLGEVKKSLRVRESCVGGT